MLKKILISLSLLGIFLASKSQSLDSLKLIDSDIPQGYKQVNQLMCKTPHSSSFYQDIDLYESLTGKIERKDFQSFQKKGDAGSILYFQFEKEFQAQAFLNGVLWGSDGKPSKSEPDEYFVKGKILIIWSLNPGSPLKEISQKQVHKILDVDNPQ